MLKQLYRFLSPKFQNVFLDYRVESKPRYGYGKPPHQLLVEIISKNRETYLELLQHAVAYKEVFWNIKESSLENNPLSPTWNNGFLPGLDIINIYTMIRHFKPNRYVEVGSGNSTKVAYKAKLDGQLTTTIVSIDPQPRAEIDKLADEVYRQPFETLDIKIVDQLNENDLLFIDNSHRMLPNSDATVFFLEVLPKLKKGVIVHIHDIYLPYDYPQEMCDRFYSEQYGLAIFLIANSKKYKSIMPNYYVSQDAQLASIVAPIWSSENMKNVERHGGSFWLRIEE
jgi:hypothetical protein